MLRSIPGLVLMSLLFGSCAGTQQLGQVRDDVYYLPSTAPPVASTETAPMEEIQQPVDDYYDPNAASESSNSNDFYDMTYNDPYYYNYGRFGFNANMGWQSGWGGPGWGMGMGWGSGYYPWYSVNVGWGSPYYPWGHPYGWNAPWGWNDPWYGYGYGGYYGPYGSCYCCYTPIIIGGSSGMIYGHRPSVNGGGVASTNGSGNGEVRSSFRDPVGLAPHVMERGTMSTRTDRTGVNESTRSSTFGTSSERPSGQRPSSSGRGSTMERSNNGGSDRGGSFSSPRSIGGGGNSGGGSGGGGSRSGGGGRPR